MGSVCRPSPVLAVFVQRSLSLGDWGFLVSFALQTLPPCLQHPEQPSCICVTLCFLIRLHFSHAFLKFPLTRMEEVCKRPHSDGTGTSEWEAQQIVGDKLGAGSAQPRAQSSLPSTVHSSAHSFIPKRPVAMPVLQASALSPTELPVPTDRKVLENTCSDEVWGQESRPPTPSRLPRSLELGQGRWQRAGRP